MRGFLCLFPGNHLSVFDVIEYNLSATKLIFINCRAAAND